jgi:hypothetical protein
MQNKTTTIALLVIVAATLAFVVVAPLSITKASAAISTNKQTTCDQTQSGGSTSGPCPGQSLKSPNKQETTTCTATNPAGNQPTGQQAKKCPGGPVTTTP